MRWIFNIASNYLKFLINMVVVFFLTPFIISTLGIEEFGLWSLVFAVIGIFGLLDFGFATAAVKYVAEAVGSKDHSGLSRIISSLAVIYSVIGIVCLLLVLLLASPASYLFDLDETRRQVFSSILLVVGIAVSLSFPLSIFKAIMLGSGRMVFVNGIEVLMSLTNAGLVVYLLSSGFGLQGLAYSAAATMLGNLVLLVPMVRKMLPDVTISLSNFSSSQVKELLSFSVYAFIANIAVLIILRIDPIVIGMFLPLSAIAIYAIAAKIAEYTYLLNKQFSNALMPLVSQAKGRSDHELIHRILVDGTRFLMAIALPFIALLFFYAPEIVNVWVGHDFDESIPLLRILLVAVFFTAIQLNAANVLGMTGMHKFVAHSMAASALINLVLSVVLVQLYGLTGVAVATLTAAFVIEALIMVPRSCKSQGISGIEFLRRGILPAVPAAVPMLLLAWLLADWRAPETIGLIVLEGGAAALVYFILFLFTGVSGEERKKVVAKIRAWRAARSAPAGEES